MLTQQVFYFLCHCSSSTPSLSFHKISHIVDFSEDVLVIIFHLISFWQNTTQLLWHGSDYIISGNYIISILLQCLDLSVQLVKWLLHLTYTGNAYLKINNHLVSNILRTCQCLLPPKTATQWFQLSFLPSVHMLTY